MDDPRSDLWHGTTILTVRKGGSVVIGGDGQVSIGQTVVKANARKVRRLGKGDVIGGFAGATADAFTLFERLEGKLDQYPGQLMRGRLERERGGVQANGLLRLLDQLGPVLGNGTKRLELRGLEYRNGVLEIALRAPDTGALDLVREQIGALAGLKAELTAANAGQDGVDGRVRVESTSGRGGAP